MALRHERNLHKMYPESHNSAIFRTWPGANSRRFLSLVRTRSPVQIWLAAPETTVSDLLTVVFLLCSDRVLPGAWGRRAGEAEQSPHVLSPRGPRKYGVFLGRNGSPVQIWLAAHKTLAAFFVMSRFPDGMRAVQFLRTPICRLPPNPQGGQAPAPRYARKDSL